MCAHALAGDEKNGCAKQQHAAHDVEDAGADAAGAGQLSAEMFLLLR